MFKRILSLSAIALLFALGAQAQSKAVKTSNTTETKVVEEKPVPYTAEEEEAARKRIESYEQKVVANKDNDAVDYEAEKLRIAEMKAEFNKRATTKLK